MDECRRLKKFARSASCAPSRAIRSFQDAQCDLVEHLERRIDNCFLATAPSDLGMVRQKNVVTDRIREAKNWHIDVSPASRMSEREFQEHRMLTVTKRHDILSP